MAKEKVTLTLDAVQLDELRRLAGARSLSAAVDERGVRVPRQVAAPGGSR